MNDQEFIKELREDLQDLIEQVDLADNLEDLEKGLMDTIAYKLWMVGMEVDDVGGSIQ